MVLWQFKLAPPLLALTLLGGLTADTLWRPRAKDAEPFHARVREAAANIPMVIGQWKGVDQPARKEAIKLLRPNVILQRAYYQHDPRTDQVCMGVHFLLVQCKDARDMGGHYPPICYRGEGWELTSADSVDWVVDKTTIVGKEYHFVRANMGRTESIFVCDFFVMPDGRWVRDMSDIYRTGGDYLRRFYGCAQIQILFPGDIPLEQRRGIFRELISANRPILDALRSGGKDK